MTARICADCGNDARSADGSYATRKEEDRRTVRYPILCAGCALKSDAAKGGKR